MSDMRIADKRFECEEIVPTNRICRTTGDAIKFYDDISEWDKPAFQEMQESDILDMFKHMMMKLSAHPDSVWCMDSGASW